MKKLLLSTILIAGFAAVSCKKCQTCTTSVSQNYGGSYPQTSTSSEEYCGKNYDDAPEEGTTTQSGGGITQTVVIECHDK